MATDHSVGYPADSDHGRPAIAAAREATETVLETLLRPTSIDVRDRCQPDGEWHRVEDGPFRKTWSNRRTGVRVQLETSGLTGNWSLEYQDTDGSFEVVDTALEREAAYARAEQFMADLDSVEARCRTGRAMEDR